MTLKTIYDAPLAYQRKGWIRRADAFDISPHPA